MAKQALSVISNALTLLGLYQKANKLIDEQSGNVEFTVNDDKLVINPAQLVSTHALNSESDVVNLDAALRNAYEECTRQVVNQPGRANDVEMFRARIVCMELKGYGTNECNYYRIKQEAI